ncbi:hypothetical protein PINS_up005654 [Pythium insidiosum]|nr:hypothetical protein PINS_up005654 [Pythium insidiosum]
MKSLMCVVIGDRSVFVVDIDDRKKVAHLKKMIKEEKPSIIKCDADQLTLYVAKKGGNWLKADDSDVLQLKEGVVTTVISDMMKNAMDPSYRVRNTAFGFPDEDAAEDGEIHVLVELPKDLAKRQLAASQAFLLPNKRSRSEIVHIDVPQITLQGVNYVTLPAAFLEKCGFGVPSDVMLYRRSQVKGVVELFAGRSCCEEWKRIHRGASWHRQVYVDAEFCGFLGSPGMERCLDSSGQSFLHLSGARNERIQVHL